MGVPTILRKIFPYPLPVQLFSIFFVSIIASKILHLCLHADAIKRRLLLLYFPTLFVQDVMLALFVRYLFKGGEGWLSSLAYYFACFISLFSFLAVSCQLSFFHVMGSEIRWEATGAIATSPDAIRMMASGLIPFMTRGLMIYAMALALCQTLFNIFGNVVNALLKPLKSLPFGRKAVENKEENLALPVLNPSTSSSSRSSVRNASCKTTSFYVILSAVTIYTIVLLCKRPEVPYDHISKTLPIATLAMFASQKAACITDTTPFPLRRLTDRNLWEPPKGDFKGWAPSSPYSSYALAYMNRPPPSWLPEELPDGFFRWANMTQNRQSITVKSPLHCLSTSGLVASYNPVADPLRISNTVLDPFDELKEVFDKSSAKISHVVLLTLESMRKEIFPIKKDSAVYKDVLSTYPSEPPKDLDEKLSKMTRVAQQITGDRFSSRDSSMKPLSPIEGEWQDPVPADMGGLNVRGAITGSSVSLKSILGSHCGVSPLMVDFTEEVTADIYQPCLPNIFKLFNKMKEGKKQKKHARKGAKSGKEKHEEPHPGKFMDNHGVDPSGHHDGEHKHHAEEHNKEHEKAAWHDRKWRSLFIQSATDTFDRQRTELTKFGFDKKIALKDLEKAQDDDFHLGQRCNYFGYCETDLEKFFRQALNETLSRNQRLFLSHFTSSTHHPWNIPKWFQFEDYFGELGDQKQFNRFFNTIHYTDYWIGKILSMLHEYGIANETLVVIVGDHGQAFSKDAPVVGTHENPHISNFRVPLIFRHPQLPRIQIDANATSMSILPTILDLLVNTRSLNSRDSVAARDLLNDYEGQSLMRPFIPTRNGRQSYIFSAINAGGTMLSVASASVPFRVVLPLTDGFPYRFTHLKFDPEEKHPLVDWQLKDLTKTVSRVYGTEAATWMTETESVARWFVTERLRLYHYEKAPDKQRP